MKNKITFKKLYNLMKLETVTIRLCDRCNTWFEIIKTDQKNFMINDKILCISCYKKVKRKYKKNNINII